MALYVSGRGDERRGVRGPQPADGERGGRGRRVGRALARAARRRAPAAPHSQAEVSTHTTYLTSSMHYTGKRTDESPDDKQSGPLTGIHNT